MRLDFFYLARFILLSMLAVTPTLPAGAQAEPHPIPGGGASDLLNVTKFPLDEPTAQKSPGVRVFVNCTDDAGNVLTKSDPGYDQCLRKGAGPARPKAAPGAGASVGITNPGDPTRPGASH